MSDDSRPATRWSRKVTVRFARQPVSRGVVKAVPKLAPRKRNVREIRHDNPRDSLGGKSTIRIRLTSLLSPDLDSFRQVRREHLLVVEANVQVD